MEYFTDATVLETVDFKQVEELDAVSIEGAGIVIALHKRLDTVHGFAPNVIRGVPYNDSKQMLSDFLSRFAEGPTARQSFIKGSKMLHADTPYPNHINWHQTNTGSCEAKILHGSFFNPIHLDRIKNFQLSSRLASMLIGDSVIDRRYISPPIQAYTVLLNEGDILLFDASNPHVFTPIENPRNSMVVYEQPPI